MATAQPSLTRLDAPELVAPTQPSATILMLHGGKPNSHALVDGRSASWQRTAWMARSLTDRAHAAGTNIWLLRYSGRGWNGDGAGRIADTRWALDEVRETHGDQPVILLGHSMGARVAVHVADDPSVVGVVALAPWWSATDPVHSLAGRTLIAAHGRRDRLTSFAETQRFVRRARTVAASAEFIDMGPLGHYMLKGADAWNDVALKSVLRLAAPS
ncbi:alpha/beta hydrolase [Knoellia sp. CPCC 206453]|uniref:alpha/beta hydrolase n=1 Tax=Knoellia pratensis TaxID=3404796 RepID=UPI00360970ED